MLAVISFQIQPLFMNRTYPPTSPAFFQENQYTLDTYNYRYREKQRIHSNQC